MDLVSQTNPIDPYKAKLTMICIIITPMDLVSQTNPFDPYKAKLTMICTLTHKPQTWEFLAIVKHTFMH
jgi:hypothetical protein